jgi:TolA-binding protein
MTKKIYLIILALILFSSCVYYNTLYNAEKKFKDAEKNQFYPSKRTNPRNIKIEPNRAEKPTEPQISVTDKSLYKAAIEKATKVIVYHPKSKYVDDALWIIGKSRYNITEYIASDKKLKELAIRFPDSKYADDANYYIGMGHFWMQKYDIALEAFNEIIETKDTEYKDDASFMIAYIGFLKENYNDAINSFEGLLKTYPNSDSAATSQYFIGACQDSLGEYLDALNAYFLVKNYGPSHELYFDAHYAYGSTAYKADSIELGMSIFSDLLKKERYFQKSSIIHLKLAKGLFLQGNIEDAESEYLKVIEQFPKTNQSAEAYYQLGSIYQDAKDDLDAAKQYFNDATKEKRGSPVYNLALTKSANIVKLETYRTKLGKNSADGNTIEDSTQIDTTNIEVSKEDTVSVSDSTQSIPPDILTADSTNIPDNDGQQEIPPFLLKIREMAAKDGLIPEDSIYAPPPIPQSVDSTLYIDSATDSNQYASSDSLSEKSNSDQDTLHTIDSLEITDISEAFDSTEIQDSLQAIQDSIDTVNEDIEIRFLLAELYHHDLNRPDSALQEYISLAETYPQSKYSAKALLASAYIYESKNDSINAQIQYLKLIDDYPTSDQSRFAVKKVEGATISPENNIELYYSHAEDLYYNYNNLDSAILVFDFIENSFPQSEYAAKSAFAKAWIINNNIVEEGDSSSYYEFTSIVDKYPETPYALEAKIKLGLIKKELPPARNIIAEEDELSPEEDSLLQAEVDSLKKHARDLRVAPPVKDTGLFVWPDSLLKAKFDRTVIITYKIKISLFGDVDDYQLLGPSGNNEIDSLANIALENTLFNMDDLSDLAMQDEYFRYDMRLVPPDPRDYYNDPYYNR